MATMTPPALFASPQKAKISRLEARISEEQKALFQRAADLQGRSLSDFIVASAQEAATRAISEYEMIELSARDRARFFEAIANPPVSNEKSKAAAKRFKDAIGV